MDVRLAGWLAGWQAEGWAGWLDVRPSLAPRRLAGEPLPAYRHSPQVHMCCAHVRPPAWPIPAKGAFQPFSASVRLDHGIPNPASNCLGSKHHLHPSAPALQKQLSKGQQRQDVVAAWMTATLKPPLIHTIPAKLHSTQYIVHPVPRRTFISWVCPTMLCIVYIASELVSPRLPFIKALPLHAGIHHPDRLRQASKQVTRGSNPSFLRASHPLPLLPWDPVKQAIWQI
jgi:hypothetical protein